MRKFHIAISTSSIEESVRDYSIRLREKPCALVEGEYALWRTETLNVSIRQDPDCSVGQMRHLGWEGEEATTDAIAGPYALSRFRAFLASGPGSLVDLSEGQTKASRAEQGPAFATHCDFGLQNMPSCRRNNGNLQAPNWYRFLHSGTVASA